MTSIVAILAAIGTGLAALAGLFGVLRRDTRVATEDRIGRASAEADLATRKRIDDATEPDLHPDLDALRERLRRRGAGEPGA